MLRIGPTCILCAVILVACTRGAGAASPADIQCFAANCYGRYSYQQRCPAAREKAREICRGAITSKPCEAYTRTAEATCGCESKCMFAHCRKFPIGPNPDNECSDASW